jgi:hypothetical protein
MEVNHRLVIQAGMDREHAVSTRGDLHHVGGLLVMLTVATDPDLATILLVWILGWGT